MQHFCELLMICKDINNALNQLLAGYDKDQVCFLVDKNCPLSTVASILTPLTFYLEPNEANKSLETVTRIWDFLLAHHITRRGVLVCIGGGIITDLGGFAAAAYKRGIDYINIPTTLLAMVDASTGGKTGFNYGGLKNAIGAFHQPVETLIWPQWLTTLPVHHLLSGFAEMLKTGLIEDQNERLKAKGERLWDRLLQYDLDTWNVEKLTPLIEQCIAIKSSIVASDPLESGPRKALNLGHTFGHALEEMSLVHRTSSNRSLLHGYAVLYGLIAELYLSVTLLGCPKEPLQQLTQLILHYYGRPNCNCKDREQLIALMQQDKKNERTAEINCTLIRSIGQPVLNQTITTEQANEALDYLFSL